MQINRLPKTLRELALQRRREYGYRNAEANDVQSLWCAFDWKRTPEGVHFWDLVDDGRFNRAMSLLSKQREAH